tara:strand:- start:620 stop:859 length:240 start_codon:yes stop_codon:yes gene_type:complete
MKKLESKIILSYLKNALKISSKKKITINSYLKDIIELDSFGWLLVIEYLDKRDLHLNVKKITNIKKVKDLKKIILKKYD